MSSGANRPFRAMTPILSCGAYKHHLLSYLGIGSLPWTAPSLVQSGGDAAGLYEEAGA